jgi:protein-S-isoprenylcysteine O-methyltransferase Ste14
MYFQFLSGARESQPTSDLCGVNTMTLELRIPPPVVAGIAAVVMYAIDKLVPASEMSIPLRDSMAILLVAVSLYILLSSVLSFRRHETTTNPLVPDRASSLVRSGVFRFTRNPMYLGMLLALTAWAVWLSNWLGVLVLAGFVAYITRYQIMPEERALAAKFGSAFDEYAARVRRWI